MDVELVELVPEYGPKGADLRKGSLVFAEEFLSTLDIFDVTDDAGLGIGGQAFEESVLPVDFFEDDQTLPSLAGVVRHSLVLTEEEEFEFLGSQLEDRRNRELRRFVVLRHEGLF